LARRTFDVVDIVEILIHWHAGRSHVQVAESLGLDRKTVRKYVTPAVASGIVPGVGQRTQAEWADLVKQWFPEITDRRVRQTTWPEFEAHREFIVTMTRAGVTKQTIWQRLRDEHGLRASVSSLKRFMDANLPEENLRSRVTVLREDPPPGEEAQIDYGYLGSWVDPVGGKRRRVWAFVMVLACSRLMFVRPVLTMDQRAWTEAHVEAFAFFGGVPKRLVPDNLRTGVARPDLYDPKINRCYAELADHYGALVDPARRGKPKDKPRVERPMPYVRDSLWRGREWISVAQMQSAAITWCRDVAGQRSCRPLGGASPQTVFDAVEAETLTALPGKDFVLADWATGTVGPDIHVKSGRTLYSVPWRFIGRKVDIRSTYSMVQIFDSGELIATHVRKPMGKQSDLSHYPPEKVAFAMKGPTWCRNRAADIGEATVAVIAELLSDNALFRLRAAQGVLGLADRHGPARLDKACAKAIAVGDPSYRTIKGILAAGLEADPLPPSTGDAGAAAFLHGPSRLFGNVVALPNPNSVAAIRATTATGMDTTATGSGHDGPDDGELGDRGEHGDRGEGVSA
jgi:transposase